LHVRIRVGRWEKAEKRGEQFMSAKTSRNHFQINRRHLLAGLLATGLSVPALVGQSVQFPTYTPGENLGGSQGPDYPSTLPHPWVVSDGTIITPAGTQVYLGTTTRAKAVALNPFGNHTAAVLQMGAPQAVTIFNTQTGAVLQNVKYGSSSTGSANGIAYTPDGAQLLFSQDNSYVAYVKCGPAARQQTAIEGSNHRRRRRMPPSLFIDPQSMYRTSLVLSGQIGTGLRRPPESCPFDATWEAKLRRNSAKFSASGASAIRSFGRNT
jgi:hypothetical protein